MRKKVSVYKNGTFIDSQTGELNMKLLFVTESVFRASNKIIRHYEVKGIDNPFPFTSFYLDKLPKITIDDWLRRRGWVKIGHSYEEVEIPSAVNNS